MKMRWMRWLGGLFGALLLCLSGWLGFMRPSKASFERVLLLVSDDQQGKNYYALGSIGSSQLQPLLEMNEHQQYAGWSPNGRLLFFAIQGTGSGGQYDLHRVDFLLNKSDRISSAHSSFFQFGQLSTGYWTPDQHWIIFPESSSYNTQDLIAYSATGSRYYNLTQGKFTSITFSDPPGVHFSPDSQWVYFEGVMGSNHHYFRARIDGTEVQDITPNASCSMSLRYAEPAHDLLAFYCQSFSPGGSSSTLITMDGAGQQVHNLGDSTVTGEVVWEYLASYDLLLVTNIQTNMLNAIRLSDGEMVWSIPTRVAKLFVTPDDSTILFWQIGGGVGRVKWDGTDFDILSSPLTSYPPMTPLLRDNSIWLVPRYTHYTEVWRMTLDGEVQLLATFQSVSDVGVQVDANREWVLFAAADSDDGLTQFYRMRYDGSDLQKLTNNPNLSVSPVAIRTGVNLSFRPFPMVVFGTFLILIPFLRLPKKRGGGGRNSTPQRAIP